MTPDMWLSQLSDSDGAKFNKPAKEHFEKLGF